MSRSLQPRRRRWRSSRTPRVGYRRNTMSTP